MAVNRKTNRVYVTRSLDALAVINGLTVGDRPTDLIVNSRTHRVYVINSSGDSVSVIRS